jgi:segregation and condensation protein B
MSKENMKELENQIEAILFASGKGVNVKKLAELCETNEKEILKAMRNLKNIYDERDSSLQISEHTDKWKLTVKSKYVHKIEMLVSETEMSQTVLKTLAMIAFKSPVLQSEIIDARGQSAYDHIKVLVQEKFVTKEESGRSYILKITDKFYEYFDVEGDLEIRELFSKLREEHTQKLGELEIVDIDELKNIKTEQEALEKGENLDDEKSLLELKVVDSEIDNDGHDKLFEDEEKKELIREEKINQKKFLSDIDSKIEAISSRIKSHEDIIMTKREDKNDEYDDEDAEEYNDNNEQNTKKENKDEKKYNSKNNDDLKSLEEFAENKKKKDDDEETFL